MTLESGCKFDHATAVAKLQIINLVFCANLADSLLQDEIAYGQGEKAVKI